MSSKNNSSRDESPLNIKEEIIPETDLPNEEKNLLPSNQNIPSSSFNNQSKENESNSGISKDSSMSILKLDLSGPPRILSSTSSLPGSLNPSLYKIKRSCKTLNNYKPISIGIVDQPQPEWPIKTIPKSESKESEKKEDDPNNSIGLYHEINQILEDLINKRVTPDVQPTTSVTWGPITRIMNSQIDPNKISDSFIKHSKQVRRLSNNLLKKEEDISEETKLNLDPHAKSSIRMVHYYDMEDKNSNQPSNDSQTPSHINKQSLEIKNILINKDTSQGLQNVNKSSSQFKKLSFKNSIEIQNTHYEPSTGLGLPNERENLKEVQTNLIISEENKEERLIKNRSNENLFTSSLKNDLQEDHSFKKSENILEEKNKIQENDSLENHRKNDFSEGEIEIETSDDSDYTSIDNFVNNFNKDKNKNISLKKLTLEQILKNRNEIESSGKRVLNLNLKNPLPLYTFLNKTIYARNIPVEKSKTINQDDPQISQNDSSDIAEKLNEYINYPIEKHSKNLIKLDTNKEINKDPAQEVKEIFTELKELLKFAKPAADAVKSFEDFEKHLKSLKKDSLNFRKLNYFTTNKKEIKETDEVFKISDEALKSLENHSKENEMQLKDFEAPSFELSFDNSKEDEISKQNEKELLENKENLNFTHQDSLKEENEILLESNEEFVLKKPEESDNIFTKKSNENDDTDFLNCNYDTSNQNVSNSLTTLVEFKNSASFITKSPLQDIYSILDELLFRAIFESNICCSSFNSLKQIHASPATIDLQLIISKGKDKGECSQKQRDLDNIRKIFNSQSRVKVKPSPACFDLKSHSQITQQKLVDYSRSLKFLHEYFPRDMIDSNETLELVYRKEIDETFSEISEDNLEEFKSEKLFYTPIFENFDRCQLKNENSHDKTFQENPGNLEKIKEINSNEINLIKQMIDEKEEKNSSQDNNFSLHLDENIEKFKEKDDNSSFHSEISPSLLRKDNLVEFREKIKNYFSIQNSSDIPPVKENITEFNRDNRNFLSENENKTSIQLNETKGKNENFFLSEGNHEITSSIKIRKNLIEEIKNFSLSQLKNPTEFVNEKVESEVKEKLESEVEGKVEFEVEEKVKFEVKEKVDSEVKEKVEFEVEEKVESEVKENVDSEVKEKIESENLIYSKTKHNSEEPIQKPHLSSAQEKETKVSYLINDKNNESSLSIKEFKLSSTQVNENIKENTFPFQGEIENSLNQIKEITEKISNFSSTQTKDEIQLNESLINIEDKNINSISPAQNEILSSTVKKASIQEIEFSKDIIEKNNKQNPQDKIEKVEKVSEDNEQNEIWSDKQQKVESEKSKIKENSEEPNNNTLVAREANKDLTLPSLELSSELSSLLSESVQRLNPSPGNVTFKLSNNDTNNFNNVLKTTKLLSQSQVINKNLPNKTDVSQPENSEQPRNSRCQSASPSRPRGGARKKTRVMKHTAKYRSSKHRSPKPCRASNDQNAGPPKSPVKNVRKKEENETKQKIQSSARKEENVNASNTTNKLPTTPTKKFRHSRKFRSTDDSADKDTHRRLEGPVILDTQAMRELARDPHNFFFNTNRELGGLLSPPPPPPTPSSVADSESPPTNEPSCSSNQEDEDEEESHVTPPPPIPSTSSLYNSDDRPLADNAVFVFKKEI